MKREPVQTAETVHNLKHLLQRHPLFQDLSDEALVEVCSKAAVVSLLSGEVLYTPHDRCRHVSFIVSGSLDILRNMADRQEIIMRKVLAGETLGEVTALSGSIYPGWIVSPKKSQVLEIPVECMFDLCSDRQFLTSLLKDISRKILHLTEKIDLLSGGSLEQRVRRYLLKLYEEQQSDHLVLTSPRSDLGNEFGCSRETLSRLFSKLEKQGIITQTSRSVTILQSDWLFEEM